MSDQDAIFAARRLNEATQESMRLKEKQKTHKLALYGGDGLAPANLTLPEREKVTRALVKTNTDIRACDKEMVKLVAKIVEGSSKIQSDDEVAKLLDILCSTILLL